MPTARAAQSVGRARALWSGRSRLLSSAVSYAAGGALWRFGPRQVALIQAQATPKQSTGRASAYDRRACFLVGRLASVFTAASWYYCLELGRVPPVDS